jgi:hypothetical protein
MPSVEDIRRWLRGEAVKGLPSRGKPAPAFTQGRGFDLGEGPYPGEPTLEPCERCGDRYVVLRKGEGIIHSHVKWRCARTAYPWDGEGENPNRCIALCDDCAKIYDEEMDELWSEYFAGRL